MKNVISFAILLISILLTGCINPNVDSIRNDPEVYAPSPIPVNTNIISITNNAFSPQIIEIAKGETISVVNLDNTRHLVISDPHPEHNKLPDFYSDYLILNESYKYTFTKSGNFGIHLEDNPSVSAKIIVK